MYVCVHFCVPKGRKRERERERERESKCCVAVIVHTCLWEICVWGKLRKRTYDSMHVYLHQSTNVCAYIQVDERWTRKERNHHVCVYVFALDVTMMVIQLGEFIYLSIYLWQPFNKKGEFSKKSKIIFFSEFFSIDYLELVYSKNYFGLTKIFVLRLFKMARNQTEYSRHEQRSIIKFLVAKKWEIWWQRSGKEVRKKWQRSGKFGGKEVGNLSKNVWWVWRCMF